MFDSFLNTPVALINSSFYFIKDIQGSLFNQYRGQKRISEAYKIISQF